MNTNGFSYDIHALTPASQAQGKRGQEPRFSEISESTLEKMFRRVVLSFGSESLRIFVSQREPVDAYTTVASLAAVFGLQPAAVHEELFGPLIEVPELSAWLSKHRPNDVDDTGSPAAAPNTPFYFAPSAAWKMLVKRCVPSPVWANIKDAIRRACAVKDTNDHIEDEGREDAGHNKRPRPEDSDHVEDHNNDNNDNSSNEESDSGSDSSDSSSEGSLFGGTMSLPPGVPTWVLTDPVIPDQFSGSDYTKSYSLKSYDMTKSLQKELKKLRKWWTKERNAERKGAKSVQDGTADKREERILCFLGFVQRYKCLPSDDLSLTLALFLNHRLFESYLDYLKQVREASDGTIGEALTSAISACRWLYRKESSAMAKGSAMPQVIRRYMDYRNIYQAKATRTRVQNDVDELQEQNKWLEWSDFTALIAKLRSDWDNGLQSVDSEKKPTVADAQYLHDLLLLGLYSCVPGRGAEVRLLQYIPEEDITKQWKPQQQMTMKKWVDKQKINLITRAGHSGAGGRGRGIGDGGGEGSDGVWKMYVSQYKNYRSRGVDVTELTESNFGWWTALLESYLETYRPLLVASKSKDQHDFVFVTRHGTSFTANYFSDFLSTLLFRHTGQRVATNILRSSFVTHFYSSDEAQDPVLRESVATVMRHSVDQALRVYDRRSTASKKHKGLQLLASRHQQPSLSHHHPNDYEADAGGTFPSGTGAEKSGSSAVVLFQRVPHQVIREVDTNGDRLLLLGKMVRSLSSNEPVYFLPADAVFHHQPCDHCIVLEGEWHEESGEFALRVQ